MTEETSVSAMPLDRARAISTAIQNAYLWAQGIIDHKPDLAALNGVSLAEMLASKAAIEAENRAARARSSGGSYPIFSICDDRLIAAAYVLVHYEPDRKAIVADSGKAVAVLPLRTGRKRGA
ncbi:MAG: hypothetical protein J0H82_05920 [Alphaproteobacteria bacterium]|nr:hypothetical protein [Alphaproteobacteria bacterium]